MPPPKLAELPLSVLLLTVIVRLLKMPPPIAAAGRVAAERAVEHVQRRAAAEGIVEDAPAAAGRRVG